MADQAELILEHVIVLRAQTGDEAAFVELVERFAPRLRYYLAKMLGRPPSSVDDLLQDIWLDAWRGLAGLRSGAAFRSWLYTLARHRGLAHLRRQARQPEPLGGDVEEATADEFTAEEVQALHQALGGLPDGQREVLVLRFLEGMSYAEIAAIVECPEGTVKSRIHHAKLALRSVLTRSMP